MSTENVEVNVEVPVPEPETEPVVETPPVVVVNTDSEPDTATDGVVGAVIDQAGDIAELRAENERLAQELEALRASHAVTAVVAEVAAEDAQAAALAAEQAANPPADPEQDEEPDRRSKFHKMWFGGNK